MIYLVSLIYLGLCYLVAAKIGRNKQVGFLGTILFCLFLSPFIGFLIAECSAQMNPRGCAWCGNVENEAEFCGLCGKNEAGDIRPNFQMKK